MFATVFFGILDTKTGNLTYINGGHLPPMLINKSGVKQCLKRTGPAVGVVSDTNFEIQHIVIEKGELLFSYTDGLTDTANPDGEYFGEEKLISLLVDRQMLPSLLEQIQEQVETFSGGAKQIDDITMLAVRRMQ